MPKVVSSTTVDRAGLDAILAPRNDVVAERSLGSGRYELVEGPMSAYRRTVVVEHTDDAARVHVTQTVDFELAVPYFAWLFVVPMKRTLARPPRAGWPWWAPPARLDARASSVLGTLAGVGVIFGYLNTLFNQTVAFAADEFHASDAAQGVAGAVVRFGALLSLVLVAAADRRGRRSVLVVTTVAGCVFAASGAVVPSLLGLTASQVVARAFSTAILIVALIVLAEEMPPGARAYAVSLETMAAGLGAGFCVLALRLADLDVRAWRLLYALPLLALPLARDIARRLPESQRFSRAHADVPAAGHGQRLWLLAASGFLLNLFVAPDAQFGNRFLKHERHFTGGRIAALSLVVGTVGAVGVIVGGRLADVYGRRAVAAIALVCGTALTVIGYFVHGWVIWAVGFVSTLVADAWIPALLVYGPELFPTALRGRANGVINVVALVGSGIGLLAAGAMGDAFGHLGPAMAILAAGPAVLAVLVLAAYPETAGRELEDLNPEDLAPG